MNSLNRVMIISVIALVVLLVSACQPVVLPAASTAAEEALDPATVTRIETLIEETMQAYQVPGCAVSIVKDGQMVYAKGFGVTELGSDQPVTPQSVFHLASIAKTATATGIMQLVAQGKIDLDAPVIDYLPYFALADELAQTMTIRQLLSHTAGMPDVEDWMADFQSPAFDDEALERQVRSMSTRSLLFNPGEGWDYSSAGFNALGDVIAKVSGQSYEDYIQEHIFTPLGMTHTSSLLKDVDPELLVSPHIIDETGQVGVNEIYPYSRLHGPSNNLYTNVEDMARYALAHLNRGELDGVRILPEAAYDEMWTIVSDTWFPLELQQAYGLGWTIGERDQHRVVGHPGLDFGFNAILYLIPEQATGFLLTCNYAEFGEELVFPATIAADPIVDALLEDVLLGVGATAAAGQKTVIEFEAIDAACPDGNIVLSEEPLLAGGSEVVDVIQEPGEKYFLINVDFSPAAYPAGGWIAPGEGVDRPDGGYLVIHRGYGTGEFEGSQIVFTATPAEDLADLPCEPVGPVAKLEGVIIRPAGQ